MAISPTGGTVYVSGYSTASSGIDYATAAYNAATGASQWVKRYNGPANSTDAAHPVATNPSTGAVYVTELSYGPPLNGTYFTDYLTVAYSG